MRTEAYKNHVGPDGSGSFGNLGVLGLLKEKTPFIPVDGVPFEIFPFLENFGQIF